MTGEYVVTVTLTADQLEAVLAAEHDALIKPPWVHVDGPILQALASFRRAAFNQHAWQIAETP